MMDSTPLPCILIKNLTHSFGDQRVLNQVNVTIDRGECFGIVGPNGAGKTTILNILATQMKHKEGEVFVQNLNVKTNPLEVRRRIGIVGQEDDLDPELTTAENLFHFAQYFGIPSREADAKTVELLRNVQLAEHGDRPIHSLSEGMRRRLALARGLINNPEVLILDEPTAHLDANMRQWIWNYLLHIKEQGTTIVLTTHFMEEAETLCDRVVLMDQGRILEQGSPGQLIKSSVGDEVIEFLFDSRDIGYYVGRLREMGMRFEVCHNKIAVFLERGTDTQKILAVISASKTTIRKAGLSDVFLKAAGHELLGRGVEI